MAIGIVVTDGQPIFLTGLEAVLRREKDFKLLACCATGEETLLALRKQRPDVLLLDLQLREGGFDVMRQIKKEKLPVRVVLLAALLEDRQVVKAVRLGARGVVLKGMSAQLLIQCIRKVHSGGRWLESDSDGRALEQLAGQDEAARDAISLMSRREVEIVGLVASGLRNQEIARKLFISEGTVKVHLHNIYHKLSLNGRFALGCYARERNLVN